MKEYDSVFLFFVPSPKALRTHVLKLFGPKDHIFKGFWAILSHRVQSPLHLAVVKELWALPAILTRLLGSGWRLSEVVVTGKNLNKSMYGLQCCIALFRVAYMYTYIYIYIHVHIFRICTYIYVYIDMYLHVYIYIYARSWAAAG